jgi:transcriptional regulator with XRE-family HTH domain
MSPKSLSRVIRKLREDMKPKPMTQRALAAKAKVTPGYIAQLEMGLRKNPSLTVLKRIAAALGVPVTELLG